MQPARASKDTLSKQPSRAPVSTRCRHCGDVIGVYEPMIVITDGQARKTSKAAEKETALPRGECYHHACWAPAHESDLKPNPRPISPA